MEGVLEKKLTVTSDDTTITIAAEWSDAQMAYDIASAVQKNFIDARYDAEISVINDAIDILQQHANEEKDRFDSARNEFESVQSRIPKPQANGTSRPGRSRRDPSRIPGAPAPNDHVARRPRSIRR